MAKKPSKAKSSAAKLKKKAVVTLTHDEAKRRNIPTAEFEPVMAKELQSPLRVAYERRNRDLDPQLVWRGKDDQDWSDLVVPAPPLFIQEKVHPKALVDDLRRQTEAAELARRLAEGRGQSIEDQLDLFADFNGVPAGDAKTEFYQHDAHWSNRMILGDSLQVMASLAEREGLRGQVQCIYFDPPYGIKFNSNFQWSTTSREVQDGKADHITREPEQVRAFRDTWRDGIHSYLSYLRDRLAVARDLLTESGSIFVQISDENVHRVRQLLDEVFGDANFVSQINFRTAMTKPTAGLNNVFDYVLWYAKSKSSYKYRDLYAPKTDEHEDESTHQLQASAVQDVYSFAFRGTTYNPSNDWRCPEDGLRRLAVADRLHQAGLGKGRIGTLKFVRTRDDFPYVQTDNTWNQQSSEQNKSYVVQTSVKVIARCVLMASDPGDLVVDPTCGSGTTAYVAEQWGRRWITIDTSRVALALARARIMGARYPSYLKADSREGQLKEAEVTGAAPSSAPTHNSLRHGFVYERVPHITLKSIANNAEIDVIWERFQQRLEPLRATLNKALGKKWEESDIPREAGKDWAKDARESHARWWEQRIARQKEIDASIAAKADFEFLYDKPYEDRKKVRVAGPFTVESLSPHRTLGVDADDELIDPASPRVVDEGAGDFAAMVLENLKAAGVQQAHKEDKVVFSSIAPWPGRYICAEGRYSEGGARRRSGRRSSWGRSSARCRARTWWWRRGRPATRTSTC